LNRNVKNARFRYKASVEQISFDRSRDLNKNFILRLADCDFIDKKENVFITGSTGIAKSYIASALGQQACSLGYKVLYEHTSKLFARLKMGKADGTYLKEITKMEKPATTHLDDFGIQPLDQQSRTILMEIIEDRHGKGSTIFTSQVPVNKWHEVIGEQTIADAILDWIIDDAHRVELRGESMPKNRARLTEELIEKEN
jgi:DNA replication protein DnaC